MRYKITLESKDKQKYQIEETAEDQTSAGEQALKHVDALGWGIYQYKIFNIEEFNKF